MYPLTPDKGMCVIDCTISERDLSACTFVVDVLTIGSMSPLVKNGAATVFKEKK
jgi:hypothetical protein